MEQHPKLNPIYTKSVDLVELLKKAGQLPIDSPERQNIILILMTWADHHYRSYITRNMTTRLLVVYEQALSRAESSLNHVIDNLRIDLFHESLDKIQHTLIKIIKVIIYRRCIDVSRGKQSLEISLDESISYEIFDLITDRMDPIQDLIQEEQCENIRKLRSIIEGENEELKMFFVNGMKKRSYTAQDVIIRYLLRGQTFKQIAEEFSAPLGTVRSDWNRYLKPLVQKLAHNLGVI